MKLVPETLARELARGLVPAWLVAGDEPLLVDECADAIRARARADGYTGRDVLFVERGFDWNVLRGEAAALSLFAERRILELRLPEPKPGVDGSRALVEVLESPAPDLLLLVLTGRIEAERSTAWVKAFEARGALVEVEQLQPEQLPGWLAARLRRHGLEADGDGLALLAARCEGNLVAAQQEIDRLALLVGPGPIDADTIAQSVANSARFQLHQLGEAVLAGDAARALRILEGLEQEGEEPPLVLWQLVEELRAMLQWTPHEVRGAPQRLWRGTRRRKTLLAGAARRAHRPRLQALLGDCARIDRLVKSGRREEAWSELARLAVAAAGAGLPPRARGA